MSEFTPKTRLEKILCGVVTTAKTRLEKAVKYAVEHAGGGGSAEPLVVNVTLSENEQEKQTLTLDVTAEELYDAVEAGRVVKMVGDILFIEDTTISMSMLVPVEIFRGETSEACWYTVKLRADMTADDVLFCAEGLLGDSNVVLTATSGD